MHRMTAIATALAVFGVSATAQAGHRDDYDDRYGDGYAYADGNDYAEVLSSRPIYRDVRVAEPRQECYDQRVVYDDGYRRQNNEGVGALLGAVVGGVVGNRFGHGGGRVATTAVGAVVGASAGASLGRNSGGYQAQPSYGYEQRCQTVDAYRVESRVEAYDVTYRYHGHVYGTRLPYDPGDRLAVDVDVRPADR